MTAISPGTEVPTAAVVVSGVVSQLLPPTAPPLPVATPSTLAEFTPEDVVCLSLTSAWVSSPDSEARKSENREARRWGQQQARSLRARLLTLGASPGVGDVAMNSDGMEVKISIFSRPGTKAAYSVGDYFRKQSSSIAGVI